jgi:hypothetical protein
VYALCSGERRRRSGREELAGAARRESGG